MVMEKLRVVDISKTFYMDGKRLPTLESISLRVNEREFLSILGPSGCGKTTFFNILAGIVKKDRGQIFLEGKEVESLRGNVAYMQQKDLLFPWRTIIDNALIGPEIEGKDIETYRKKASELLEQFGLRGFENRYPQELSGGMRQRAALVRTLLFEREILLLDEPFGALDAMTRAVMQRILHGVWKKYQKTILLITHDVEEALLLSDRIILFGHRPARVKDEFFIQQAHPRKRTDPSLLDLKEKILKGIFEEMNNLNGIPQ